MKNKTHSSFISLGITRIRFIFLLTLGLLILFALTPRGYAQTAFPYAKKFIISSYYTPLPGQAHYFTGSFEGDVRLNGEGVHSADGSLVYPGMAAASKDYPFGTKMNIPGFGTVAIHDRGGAIKGDRLDIWVGEGEEGLRRALGWGMRTLEVTVYGVDDNIKEEVNFGPIPLANVSWFLAKTEHFRTNLAHGDEGEAVRELQRFLKKTGYFDAEVTGYFGDETQAAVEKFQLAEKVIDSADDPGAGNFGPRSRVALESLLDQRKKEALAKIPEPKLKRGDRGEPVKALQTVLKEYGFLNEINGNFDAKTQEALLRFQLDASIVAGAKDVGAGFYGPKTKTALEKLVALAFTPSTSFERKPNDTSGTKQKFVDSLALNDEGTNVVLLQEDLRRLNFLRLAPTGYFGKTTEHAVFKFQQAFGIVKDEKTSGAGVAGPQTMAKLNELHFARFNQQKTVTQTTEQKKIVSDRISAEKVLVSEFASNVVFASEAAYGARGADIEKLQKILKRLGFFPGRLTTEYFGDITKQALLVFQKSHGLPESGALDEKTRRVLNQIVADRV